MELKGGEYMIWYFIAGFIAGVVGTLMLGKHVAEKVKGNEDRTD